MVDLNQIMLTITLYVNELNTSTKRQRLSNWIKMTQISAVLRDTL